MLTSVYDADIMTFIRNNVACSEEMGDPIIHNKKKKEQYKIPKPHGILNGHSLVMQELNLGACIINKSRKSTTMRMLGKNSTYCYL